MQILNPKIDKEFKEELQIMQDKYFAFDKSVPFCGLEIYPVLLENYNEFLVCSQLLQFNKNDTMEGISRNNLDYVLYKLQDEETGQMWSLQLSRLAELVFRIQNGVKCTNSECGKVYSFTDFFKLINEHGEKLKCDCGKQGFEEIIKIKKNEKTKKNELIVDGKIITHKDFDKLRQIKMYQNFINYFDDSFIDKALRDDKEARDKLLAKKSDGGSATLERKMMCIAATTNYRFEEIMKMTIRKFNLLLGVIDDHLTYMTSRIGLMTGMVSFKGKDGLQHWIYKKESHGYDNYMDVDTLKGVVSGDPAFATKK